MPTDGPA